MKSWKDESGIAPLLILIGVVLIVVLVGGYLLIAFTMKTMLTLILVGVGLYLLVKPPSSFAGMGPQAKLLVPLVLIIVGICIYAGVFTFWK